MEYQPNIVPRLVRDISFDVGTVKLAAYWNFNMLHMSAQCYEHRYGYCTNVKTCFNVHFRPILAEKSVLLGTLGHVSLLDFQQLNFRSLWSISKRKLSKYCVNCEIRWRRCQQFTVLSISTASVIKLLVVEQLLHLARKFTASALWHNISNCPSSQQILATPLGVFFFVTSTTNRDKLAIFGYRVIASFPKS